MRLLKDRYAKIVGLLSRGDSTIEVAERMRLSEPYIRSMFTHHGLRMKVLKHRREQFLMLENYPQALAEILDRNIYPSE